MKAIARVSAPMVLALTTSTAAAAVDKPQFDTGDTAWLLVATALAPMMNIPGSFRRTSS